MNCEQCGATLKIDQLKQVKYCPYCGAEVDIPEETPDTMAGTIHGIAKTFFNQTADKIRYNREHASEIAEQKRKDKEEEGKRGRRQALQENDAVHDGRHVCGYGDHGSGDEAHRILGLSTKPKVLKG